MAEEWVCVKKDQEPKRDIAGVHVHRGEEAKKEEGRRRRLGRLPDSGGSLTALPIIETQAKATSRRTSRPT
jgi:hypothetical protein